MKKLIFSLIFSLQIGAHASTAQQDLVGNLQDALRDIESSNFTNESCPAYLRGLVQTTAKPDWARYTNEDLRLVSLESIEQNWQVRAALHKKLADVDVNCVRAIRQAFFSLREMSDYLGEFAYNQKSLNPSTLDFQKQPTPIVDTVAYPAAHQAATLPGNFKFQSGDIMLARGVSFVSALISQITDQGTKYSHVIVVSVNPKTGEERTIESYIGVGVSTYEMPWALRNENARLLVLRPKNQELGSKAAAIALDKAQNGDGVNKPIPYDYLANVDDHSRMGCAETARASYSWASNGQVLIPALLSQTEVKNKTFMRQMNIEEGPVFAPDDLATDPNFELVLDWTDYRLTRDSRQRDAILYSIMKWVNEYQYNFHETTQSFLAKNFILPSRKTILWPLIQKVLSAPNLDRDFPKETLGVVTVLNAIGNSLLEKVKAADERHVTLFGRPMTSEQLNAYIENVRLKDQKDYVEGRRNLFHSSLRPDKLPRRLPLRR